MSRYCDGKIGFLGWDCGIVNVWKESGAVDVAILSAIPLTSLRKNTVFRPTHP